MGFGEITLFYEDDSNLFFTDNEKRTAERYIDCLDYPVKPFLLIDLSNVRGLLCNPIGGQRSIFNRYIEAFWTAILKSGMTIKIFKDGAHNGQRATTKLSRILNKIDFDEKLPSIYFEHNEIFNKVKDEAENEGYEIVETITAFEEADTAIRTFCNDLNDSALTSSLPVIILSDDMSLILGIIKSNVSISSPRRLNLEMRTPGDSFPKLLGPVLDISLIYNVLARSCFNVLNNQSRENDTLLNFIRQSKIDAKSLLMIAAILGGDYNRVDHEFKSDPFVILKFMSNFLFSYENVLRSNKKKIGNLLVASIIVLVYLESISSNKNKKMLTSVHQFTGCFNASFVQYIEDLRSLAIKIKSNDTCRYNSKSEKFFSLTRGNKERFGRVCDELLTINAASVTKVLSFRACSLFDISSIESNSNSAAVSSLQVTNQTYSKKNCFLYRAIWGSFIRSEIIDNNEKTADEYTVDFIYHPMLTLLEQIKFFKRCRRSFFVFLDLLDIYSTKNIVNDELICIFELISSNISNFDATNNVKNEDVEIFNAWLIDTINIFSIVDKFCSVNVIKSTMTNISLREVDLNQSFQKISIGDKVNEKNSLKNESVNEVEVVYWKTFIAMHVSSLSSLTHQKQQQQTQKIHTVKTLFDHVSDTPQFMLPINGLIQKNDEQYPNMTFVNTDSIGFEISATAKKTLGWQMHNARSFQWDVLCNDTPVTRNYSHWCFQSSSSTMNTENANDLCDEKNIKKNSTVFFQKNPELLQIEIKNNEDSALNNDHRKINYNDVVFSLNSRMKYLHKFLNLNSVKQKLRKVLDDADNSAICSKYSNIRNTKTNINNDGDVILLLDILNCVSQINPNYHSIVENIKSVWNQCFHLYPTYFPSTASKSSLDAFQTSAQFCATLLVFITECNLKTNAKYFNKDILTIIVQSCLYSIKFACLQSSIEDGGCEKISILGDFEKKKENFRNLIYSKILKDLDYLAIKNKNSDINKNLLFQRNIKNEKIVFSKSVLQWSETVGFIFEKMMLLIDNFVDDKHASKWFDLHGILLVFHIMFEELQNRRKNGKNNNNKSVQKSIEKFKKIEINNNNNNNNSGIENVNALLDFPSLLLFLTNGKYDVLDDNDLFLKLRNEIVDLLSTRN